ncbi:MAG TPA: 4-alpha-glucanotransferase [Thiobacillaceae bacterium]|nr:4-alpha-glucanotransferase [Thiobacillaceae bacterium]
MHRLCDLIGIVPDYYDIWGNHHPMSDETRRAILGAMGIPARTEAELEAGLQDLQTNRWRRRLPPVQVEKVHSTIRLRLNLPERLARGTFRWRLIPETGAAQEQLFIAEHLQRVDSTQLDGEPWHAYVLELPPATEPGYHRLELSGEGETTGMPLIIYPDRGFQPEPLQKGKRVWGLSVQLYGVRSTRNWGMGDFTDLQHLVEWAARNGASAVGINPLHALFPNNPGHVSPYSPSSRQYLNVMYLDVEAVVEFAECEAAQKQMAEPAFQARLRSLRAASLVDYASVAAIKFPILELLFEQFCRQHLASDSARARAFREYQAEGGADLHEFALYQALQDHLHKQNDRLLGWPEWPETLRSPESTEVVTFAAAHRERIEYFQYLQWLAEEQLGAAGTRCRELGLAVGLYQDLAVGVERSGAETWIHKDLYALDARIGCPPDDFNPRGQDWGLPPWIPDRLQEAGYAPYIAMLRANMRIAGALRVDHVMGLMRLYWVPPGMPGDQGAYVSYPFRDLLGILVLESQRNHCLIVGEDLGTVPPAVREAMHDFGLLSYHLFYFERNWDNGSFLPPSEYPEQALVAVSTHDLPTLTGFWSGADLDLRTALNLYPSAELRNAQIDGREQDRGRLLNALQREGVLPVGLEAGSGGYPEMSPALIQAVYRFIARSPAQIALVQAEDLLGEREQANLPGTTTQYPSWQRKLSLNLENWEERAAISELAQAVARERE